MKSSKMEPNEVPDLENLLTQSEDSVETLALAKTFTSHDYDEVSLNELVDLISTTIGGKPPLLPLREERLSLGVECVFNAKGVAWNLAKKNRNKMSSTEKTAELIEIAVSKIRELDCSGEGNQDPQTQKQKLKKKQLSGMTYPEYLEHLAKCQAKKKDGITNMHTEENNDTNNNEKMAEMNEFLSSILKLKEDYLSPEWSHWKKNKELDIAMTSGDLTEPSSEFELTGKSTSDADTDLVSTEIQTKRTNEIEASVMMSSGDQTDRSSELVVKTKSTSNAETGAMMSSDDTTERSSELELTSKSTSDADTDLLSPEIQTKSADEIAADVMMNGDDPEISSELGIKSKSTSNAETDLLPTEIQATSINEILTDAMKSNGDQTSLSSEFGMEVKSISIAESGLSSPEREELTDNINVESTNESAADTDFLSHHTQTESADEIAADAMMSSDDPGRFGVKSKSTSNAKNALPTSKVVENCSKSEPNKDTTLGLTSNVDSACSPKAVLESRLDSYDHFVSNFPSPDNFSSPFKGIRNSIPFSPRAAGPKYRKMKSSNACVKGNYDVADDSNTKATSLRKEDESAPSSIINKKSERNGIGSLKKSDQFLDNEARGSQTEKYRHSKDFVRSSLEALKDDCEGREERIDQDRSITEIKATEKQTFDTRDDNNITRKHQKKRNKDQPRNSFQETNKNRFAKRLMEEAVRTSRYHDVNYFDDTVSSMSSMSSNGPVRKQDFKVALEERLLRGHGKRTKSSRINRRPPLASTGVKSSSSDVLEKKIFIENGYCNSYNSDEIKKSLSMQSNATNQSSGTILSTEQVHQSIHYTYSALCRINSSLDEAEVMSVDSDDAGDYDALFFAKESKNEIAALAKEIELQIAQERSSAHIMPSTSYDTVISRETSISRASINRLIDDVNVLCSQIENKVDNIVKDTIR